MHFCCLFLKSSETIGVSLSIDGKQCVNLFFPGNLHYLQEKVVFSWNSSLFDYDVQ